MTDLSLDDSEAAAALETEHVDEVPQLRLARRGGRRETGKDGHQEAARRLGQGSVAGVQHRVGERVYRVGRDARHAATELRHQRARVHLESVARLHQKLAHEIHLGVVRVDQLEVLKHAADGHRLSGYHSDQFVSMIELQWVF